MDSIKIRYTWKRKSDGFVEQSVYTIEEIENDPPDVKHENWDFVSRDLSTGLVDSKGVEIFEGDKVRRRIHLIEGADYMDYTCDVVSRGFCFALCVAGKQLWGLDPIVARGIEVIGNIHTQIQQSSNQ